MKRYELHSHTNFSDGKSSIEEMISRANELDSAIAITDHFIGDEFSINKILYRNISSLDSFLKRRNKFSKIFDDVIFGIEITRVNPKKIPEIAKNAKKHDFIVLVHGETSGDKVPAGTNTAALNCEYVDILAHPGHLSEENALKAKENKIFIEITAREIHRSENPEIAKICKKFNLEMIIDTDAHSAGELIDYEKARDTGLNAGLSEDEVTRTNENAKKIFKKFII
ncbi:MAG: hypothetical protein BWK75_01715 [Candidatus Altiarchaeales archaeon A3]|nr:MAG: hypothetical protein BWK75_01715 [Candidatus Altiarchaeales archaeon A3]